MRRLSLAGNMFLRIFVKHRLISSWFASNSSIIIHSGSVSPVSGDGGSGSEGLTSGFVRSTISSRICPSQEASADYALRHATHLLLAGNISSELQTPTKEKFSLMYTEHAKRIHYQEVESVTPNPTWLAKLQQSIHHLQGDLPRLSLLERYAYIASSIYKQQKLTIPVCTDVGNHWYAIGKYMEMEEPLFESTTTWASIGTGMASSIGMYYAMKCPIWCFMGDGGTLFGSSDLLYLLNHPHLPITVTLYINHIYGSIFEDVQVKQDAVNEIVSVPTISILKQLPNCHFFKKEEAYASYLSAHPSSDKLRFIVISLPKPDDSNVYQIQADAAYEQHILHDRFQEMVQTPLILY